MNTDQSRPTAGTIISYQQMCAIERSSLQRGMNYRIRGESSILLMSRRKNAPYQDSVSDDGRTLIYEGHDVPRSGEHPDPKIVDQPLVTPTGRPTQNGLFFTAAEERGDSDEAEIVHVYEKLLPGTWVYNGPFQLREAWNELSDGRMVCRFRLATAAIDAQLMSSVDDYEPTRMIPSHVKHEVWIRDEGKCRECGSTDDLHFDHIIPYSKGGSSRTAANIQLLCARHNLSKSDHIR